mmetsp:Transcript_7225/g.11361  ORF Transcript_7225/g.11361 Transcript_7225/m.11361 type:complete len:138 (-) Transcript_7225:759-1172(-)
MMAEGYKGINSVDGKSMASETHEKVEKDTNQTLSSSRAKSSVVKAADEMGEPQEKPVKVEKVEKNVEKKSEKAAKVEKPTSTPSLLEKKFEKQPKKKTETKKAPREVASADMYDEFGEVPLASIHFHTVPEHLPVST